LLSQIFDPPVGSISIKFKKELKPCLVVVVSDIFQQRPVFSEELIMALETNANGFIDGLVATNPAATDGLAAADDHMRLIKSSIKATFPNVTGAITSTQAELNTLTGYTGAVADLNYAASLNATGVTDVEYAYLDGVTSAIQTQFDAISTELVNDAAPQLGGELDTNGNAIRFGASKWTIELDTVDNDLNFKYNGTTVFKLQSTGAVTSANNITAYGTP